MLYKNVLNEASFKLLKETMMSNSFPMFFRSHNLTKGSDRNNFLFTHLFYNDEEINSDFIYLLDPILNFIHDKEPETGELIRIKSNLYTNQHTHVKYGEHKDDPDLGPKDMIIGLFTVNTCNGGTVVDGGPPFPSVENTLLLFDNVPHYGISQTDTQTRIVINFNFRR